MPYYFNLPVITELTIEQQAVLNEPAAIAVSGGPGTGKSVVALWRHIRNHDSDTRHSLLLTYTKSLELYLSSSARTINQDAGDHVNRTYHWTIHEASAEYEEIIIDEAQDVNINKYFTINRLSDMVSYSADNNQSLYSNGTKEEDLENLFQNPHYRLRKNFRNSKQISQFVKSMFPDYLIQFGSQESMVPKLICSNADFTIQDKIVFDILESFAEETHNIAILVPFQNSVQYWYDKIREEGYTCSKYSNHDEEIERIENIHVTTFKSSKGLEFDTVIVPFFNQFQYFIDNYDIVEKNDYYVVFTRARTNLFLIDNSALSNNRTSLDFISIPLSRNLLEVDYDYIFNNTTTNTSRQYIEEEDDLPF
ncbi:DNA/RNA helicase domain-containing protein [Christiangramia sp.]|uniref:DNA/RNA helicase domain-containing protein n=1 Tax=Christiangramia sp. TaxID=1931228 RepID=UPI002629887F|nr:DNA/RNA helicase domain-containing protein [Christiangramia sp.]